MLQNGCELRVLVKGRPVSEYPHQGQVLVEGREGSEFDIEFINRTNDSVLAVLSVDGLSVLDGQPAGSNSPGYVVDAKQTLSIPGWKLTDEQVSRFIFSGKKQSYVSQIGGDARNSGVIGVLAYARHGVNAWPWYLHQQTSQYQSTPTHVARGITCSAGAPLHIRDLARTYSGNSGLNESHTFNAFSSNTMTGALGAVSLDNMVGSTLSESEVKTSGGMIGALPQNLNNLGTGFGEATNFKTQATTFQRGDLLTMIVLYYDDARGLKSRGVRIERASRQRHRQTTPQAFPGMSGCIPPPGWEG